MKKYFIIALGIFILTAIFSVGHNHPDEYYQIIGFASYKLGVTLAKNLPWEFTSQIRPSMQPTLFFLFVKFFYLLGLKNPFLITFFTRLLTAIFSFGCITLVIKHFTNNLNYQFKKIFIISSFFSYLVIFNAVRFTSETWSGNFLILGFTLASINNFRYLNLRYLLIGVSLALAFTFRFQVGFAILGIVLWLLIINKSAKSLILITILSFICTYFFTGILLDHWFYNNWTFTPYNYFFQNIILGKASTFGNESSFFYLLTSAFIPFGFLYVISTLYIFYIKPKSLVTWTLLPFIMIHAIVSHKELRFLIPILSFMPLCIVYTLEDLSVKYAFIKTQIFSKLNPFFKACWIFNCCIIFVVVFAPAATQLPLCKYIYDHYSQDVDFYRITEGGNLLDFYMRNNVTIINVSNPNTISCKKSICLVALTCQQIQEFKYTKGQLIYTNCPSWIFKINVNHWLERSALYNIYDISSATLK